MRIELRETGSLAGLDRRIVADEERLTVFEWGEPRTDRALDPREREDLEASAGELARARPKRRYGRTFVRVPMETVVTIDTLAVAVRPDPSTEQPPLELWRLVRAMHRAAAPAPEAQSATPTRPA